MWRLPAPAPVPSHPLSAGAPLRLSGRVGRLKNKDGFGAKRRHFSFALPNLNLSLLILDMKLTVVNNRVVKACS